MFQRVSKKIKKEIQGIIKIQTGGACGETTHLLPRGKRIVAVKLSDFQRKGQTHLFARHWVDARTDTHQSWSFFRIYFLTFLGANEIQTPKSGGKQKGVQPLNHHF